MRWFFFFLAANYGNYWHQWCVVWASCTPSLKYPAHAYISVLHIVYVYNIMPTSIIDRPKKVYTRVVEYDIDSSRWNIRNITSYIIIMAYKNNKNNTQQVACEVPGVGTVSAQTDLFPVLFVFSLFLRRPFKSDLFTSSQPGHFRNCTETEAYNNSCTKRIVCI